MKKTLFSLLLMIVCLSRTLADEGMWLPLLLGQQVYNDMVKRGLKLSKEQLYSINKVSIKDAILFFNGGCTGEIVSGQGLLFTNHHCGYDAIAKASNLTHNYLKDGFYARSLQEEIPSPGLYVEFLLRIEDVTAEVEAAAQGLVGSERAQKVTEQMAAIKNAEADLKLKLKELDIDMEKVHAADRASARDMAAKTGDIWTPRIIAGIVFLVWAVVQYHVFTTTIPDGMRELVARMLGTLDAVLMAVVYYYYGSSSGSAAKTQAMAEKK